MFELHPILEKDTTLIRELELCKLLLMDNKLYPWVILVPKIPDLVEIIDLSEENQALLMKEISLVSKIMKQEFKADKLNIGALGNMVSQLHIHIIVRYKNDETFPKPVWVSDNREFYKSEEKQDLVQKLNCYF